MIRVILPYHLRNLAKVGEEIQIDVNGSATVETLITAIESKYPVLRGTIREHGTSKRRALVRFFACGEDVSHAPSDRLLPDPIVSGAEPFFIIGAIAGG
jgi:molybdopterin synthase sulfur carrier subunit